MGSYAWNPDHKVFIGLTTDTKPVNCFKGAVAHEFNLISGERKIYETPDGGTNWVEIDDDVIGSVNISAGQTIGLSSGTNTIGNVGIVSATPLSVYSGVITHTFHNAASATGEGVELNVEAYKTLRIEITGTSSGRTVTFYGKHESGTLRAIVGCKEGDTSFTMATSTTGNNEVWVFDITAFKGIVMNLTAVSGGNVTVKGRAVT